MTSAVSPKTMPDSRSPAPDDGSRPGGATRIASLDASRAVRFNFDWQEIAAAPGETIAVALLVAGVSSLRTTSRLNEPRGIFCNMGVCFDCLIEVDGHANQRACQTIVRAGMQVRTQRGHGYTDSAPELGE